MINFLFFITRNKILSYIDEINKIEKFSLDEIKKYQKKKLNTLLLHAYKNVPYYTKILSNSGVIANNKIILDNFNKIPVLTKKIIRNEHDSLRSKDLSKHNWYYNTSGGSTGEPVKFIQDKEYLQWNIANKIYLKTFENQLIGNKELRLWGSERDILEGQEKFSIRLRNWLYNRKEFNTFLMSQEDMFSFVKDWNKFQPDWIEAYVQSIYEFAKFIIENKLTIRSPKGIVTSAGTLYPEMKKVIETVFNCKTYNRYGSREVGDMACNCGRQEGLHLSTWNHYFEILDDDQKSVNPGQMGSVYVTLLTNKSMPLIRYQIGDLAVKAENEICSCGRGTPLVAKVIGRDVLLFKTKDGKKVDGEYFAHLFYFKEWIVKFQVVQKDLSYIVIKAVLKGKEDKADIDQIEQDIRLVLGVDCKIQWNFVNRIKPLKSGKFLYTISEI